MTEILFGTIMENHTITAGGFWAATLCSLALGFLIAVLYSRANRTSPSMVMTLIMLPAIVQLVIMMVNGNIGAGVAVAGAFSLVRFRSVAGKGQEITAIFLTMTVGLATGMGYLGLAVIFTVIMMAVFFVLQTLHVGEHSQEREIRITVPEDLDFEGAFEEVLRKYAKSFELAETKTANMGSLYKLTYTAVLLPGVSTKQLLDEIRIRNGNLEVSCGRPAAGSTSM